MIDESFFDLDSFETELRDGYCGGLRKLLRLKYGPVFSLNRVNTNSYDFMLREYMLLLLLLCGVMALEKIHKHLNKHFSHLNRLTQRMGSRCTRRTPMLNQ